MKNIIESLKITVYIYWAYSIIYSAIMNLFKTEKKIEVINKEINNPSTAYKDKYKEIYCALGGDKYGKDATRLTLSDEKRKLFDKKIDELHKDSNAKLVKLRTILKPIEEVMENNSDDYGAHVQCLYGCTLEDLEKKCTNSLPDFQEIKIELQKEREECENDISFTEQSMVISPSEEKNIIKDVYSEWNSIHYAYLINNIIIENTPAGMVIMRYNSNNDVFEYYSNKSISYCFLETVSRKYAITFHCTSIRHTETVVDETDGGDEDKDKENEDEDQEKPVKLKPVKPNFKNYQTPIKTQDVLTNRYSRIGVIADFKLIKKVSPKRFDNSLNLTFSDFKKMKHSNT
jgi:hypothetical protein